jgi:hypothetical protein
MLYQDRVLRTSTRENSINTCEEFLVHAFDASTYRYNGRMYCMSIYAVPSEPSIRDKCRLLLRDMSKLGLSSERYGVFCSLNYQVR